MRICGPVGEAACRLQPDAHVGQHPLDALELGDGAVELLALLREGERTLVSPGGQPQGHGAGPHPLAVVGVHELGEAPAEPGGRHEHHVGADVHVLEQHLRLGDAPQPHGRLPATDHQPRGLVADRQEPADALLLTVLVEYPCEHQVEPRHAATGDPVLPAVQDVPVAPAVRPGGHHRGGAAGSGLRDADGRLVAIQHQAGGKAPLVVGAVRHDRRDGPHVGFDRNPTGNAALLRHLLHHQDGVQERAARTSELGRHGHAGHAGIPERLDVLPRIRLGPVHLGGAGPDDLGRHGTRSGLQVQLLFS